MDRDKANAPESRITLVSAALFGLAALGCWAIVLITGLPLAILATPWIVLAGGFVLPGPTEARLPVSAAWILALLLFADRRRLGALVRAPADSAATFAVFLGALSLIVLWSPDKGQGIRMVVQGSVALATAVVMRIGLDFVPRQLLLRSAVMAAAVLAIPITLFRVDPASEIAFLESGLGRFLIEPSSLSELLRGYWYQTNNTLDARKAGAVFINANVASVYLCMHLAAAVSQLTERTGRAWTRWAMPILLVGILATGSRIGALTAALIVIGGLGLARKTRGARPLALAIVASVLAVPIIVPTLRRLSPDVLFTDARIILWPLAVRRILDAPLLGSGFGDWDLWLGAGLERFGIRRVLPPHNLLLHLALWGGVLALASFGGFLYALARRIRYGFRCAAGRPLAVGAALLVVAVLLHAMFDNFFLFDWRVGPAAATLLALLWTGRPTPSMDVAPDATPREAVGTAG